MYIAKEKEVYFINMKNKIFQMHGLLFPSAENLSGHLDRTLVDGELVLDQMNGMEVQRFLIFDIISLNGKTVMGHDFNYRHQIIQVFKLI